ncbi:MAG: hypothetical protein OXO50_09285 [Caldilineaceae bacterium]|nr:hypothetical protein [Caldilineaceae bacterium]
MTDKIKDISLTQVEDGIIIKLEKVPSGRHYLEVVETFGDLNRRATHQQLNRYDEELHVLGVSLSIIYRVATCYHGCLGGPHIFERLAARTHNLACSAHHLIERGLYDEALNLIRSLGEIANLFCLFYADEKALITWLHSDSKTRMNDFKPVDVRRSLEKIGKKDLMLATKDWYSNFCSEYTHVHPGTKPNVHNERGQGHAGGRFQDKGLAYCMGELATCCSYIALFASQYGGLKDSFKELRTAVATYNK